MNNPTENTNTNSLSANLKKPGKRRIIILNLIGVISFGLVCAALNTVYPFIAVASLGAIMAVISQRFAKLIFDQSNSTKDNVVTNKAPKSNIEKLKKNKSWQAKIHFNKVLQELDTRQSNLLEMISNELPPVEAGTPAAESRLALFTALREELQPPQPTNETIASRTRSRSRKS